MGPDSGLPLPVFFALYTVAAEVARPRSVVALGAVLVVVFVVVLPDISAYENWLAVVVVLLVVWILGDAIGRLALSNATSRREPGMCASWARLGDSFAAKGAPFAGPGTALTIRGRDIPRATSWQSGLVALRCAIVLTAIVAVGCAATGVEEADFANGADRVRFCELTIDIQDIYDATERRPLPEAQAARIEELVDDLASHVPGEFVDDYRHRYWPTTSVSGLDTGGTAAQRAYGRMAALFERSCSLR